MTPRTNPTDTRDRVIRGGGWDSRDGTRVLAVYRIGDAPANRCNDLGFRLNQSGCHQPLKGLTPP